MCNAKSKMAAELKGFQVYLWLLFLFASCTYADLPAKCTITVGNDSYSITNWNWQVVVDKTIYYINVCGNVAHNGCDKDSSVCSSSLDDTPDSRENLGSLSTRGFNTTADAAGFSIEYKGGECKGHSSGPKTWFTSIFMKCGKFLGSPQFVDESVGDKKCVAVFEFVTSEVCKHTKPLDPEIPCSLYGDDHQLRDLTPLIKLKGGYEVATSIKNFDFHINVCRGITAVPGGHTQGCPPNGAMCRVDKNLQSSVDIGNINFASNLHFSPAKDIILVYNTTKNVPGCRENPVTTITFKCPRESADKGPLLTAARDCRFEVLWETDFACPQASIMSTDKCVLQNEFVNFDLTKLTAAKLDDYQVPYNVMEHGKKTDYIIYINVCKSLGYSCGKSETNSTVCQEKQDGKKRWSLGDLSKQTLRYADRRLTLTYESGEPCSSGLKRTTIIMFKCNYAVDKGKPVFNSESYCFYFFDWETKFACPPSRRTGTRCRVESSTGVRYDLSELVRMDQEPSWLALDGESSSSGKQIFINVCGQLTSRNETRVCETAAAVCMVDKSTGNVVNLGRYRDPPILNPDNSIKIVYSEGSECKKDNDENSIKINSTITFVCQPGDLESPPVLVSHTQDNCLYEFMWKSAAACHLGVTKGKDCKVEDTDGGYVFDLNPLARHTWKNNDFYSVVSQSQYTFQLKVCGGSNQTGCPGSNIGACQVKQQDPKSNWMIGQPNKILYYYDGMLNLTYVNGKQCHNGVSRTTHITFLCNETAVDDGIGVPEFEKENHCVYNFRWFTRYACPAKVTECVARSATGQYDLTSLVKTKDNWDAYGGGGTAYINVCRSLNLGPSVSGCSGTAAVCLRRGEHGPYVNLGSVTDSPRVEGQDVTITYTNGDECEGQTGKRYRTKITFICKTGSLGSGPEFDGLDDNGCFYKYRWETAAACKIVNVVGDNCAVKDPKSDTTFNLLPLMKMSNKALYTGNLTDNEGQGTFELNICGKVPACRKEVDNAGACLTKSDGTKIVLGVLNKKLEFKGETLTLVYKEGDNYQPTGQQREVHIKFYCDPTVPFGKPQFTEQQNNKYFFDFKTSLVCSASAVQCSVEGPGHKVYDLTPLGLHYGNWEAVDTRPKDKHLHYFINVCRSVNIGQELLKCPGGSIGACQVDHSQDKGFNLGYVQSNPRVAGNGELTLQYSGGSGCHHQFNRSIRIVFSCSNDMGSPVFLSESPECEYLFSWQTPSACALTREEGDNCTVVDKQYGYMFDLSKLYNKISDYNVSVSGSPGARIVLNVCNKLVSSPKVCAGSGGACVIAADGKSGVVVASSSHLTYFNGQISMTYGASLNFTFECDQDSTGRETGPSCEKKGNKYECRWPTVYACRPLVNVQCSVRNEDGGVVKQYDFLPLSKNMNNWQARITDINLEGISYFINVCRTVVLPKEGDAKLCPPTAGVCMVKGGKGYSLGRVKRGPIKENNNIYLIYEDGDDCGNGKNFSSRIQMLCKRSSEGVPVFVKETQGTCQYEFLWITSTACPVNTEEEVVFDNCTAVNPQTNVVFNLQKLRKTEEDYTVRDSANRTYKLNVCGPLVKPPTACGSDSGVCQIGDHTVNAGMANSRLYFDDGLLYLNLSGGDPCHHVKKKRETIISFVCSSGYGDQDHGKPVFISEDDCTYFIVWHTSLVCERQYECAAVQKGDNGNVIMYSLGRLMRSDNNWVVTNEGGSDDSYRYYVNLCRPLVPMPGTNCPAGSWACRIKGDVIQDLGRATGPPWVASKGEVRLVYKSNIFCPEDGTRKIETHFTFICGYGSLGHPILEPKEHCAIHIRWLTSAACANGQKEDLDKCRVYDNHTKEYYDLNALAHASSGLKYFTVGRESDPQYFFISVCDELHLSNAGSCTGAGVCLVTKQGDKQVYTALGYYGHRAMTYFKDERMLILKYCSDDCNSKKADMTISEIIFVCDRSQSTDGKPQLSSHRKDGAVFTWRTSLVCPPPEEECSYSDGSNLYDLRLLTSRTGSWQYEHNKDRFWINICRGIEDGPKGCPSTASVCMIRSDGSKTNVIGLTSTQKMSVKDGKLQLVYYGIPPVEGCSSGSNSKVVFYFECGNHVGQPQFQREEWSSCSFIIKWKSSVACQIARKNLEESNCVVQHPFTGRKIDFTKLVGETGSSWSIPGVDESKTKVSYIINVCGKLGTEAPSDCRGIDGVCWNGIALEVNSRTFYYEGSMFSLEMSTKKDCENKKLPAGSKHVIVINFQCSMGEGVGSAKFDYVSSNCHHFFTWPTSIVCPVDLSGKVTDIPAAHKSLKSPTNRNVGIAFGVVFAVILIAVFVIVLYKPSRRHSIISCLRWNFKRHILRKEINFPVYRYQKLGAADEDEADSLIKEAEGSDDDEENDDDDLLPF